MIKSVNTPSNWITVNQYQNPPYIQHGAHSSGMVRWNPTLYRVEVYDGNNWIELGNNVTVDLAPPAQAVLEWGRQKMAEEQRWQELAKQNPTVRDAYERFKQAEEQLRMVEILTKE